MYRLPEDVKEDVVNALADILETDDESNVIVTVTTNGDIKITVKDSPLVEDANEEADDDTLDEDDD